MLFKNKELFSNTNNKLNNEYQITKIKKNIFKSEYPIFVNFYTGDNGYRKYSDKLIKSLKKFNLPYYIIEINSNGHKWTRICQQKPYILLEVMNKYPNKNVVWIDADAIIEKEPELFKNINKSLGVHYTGGNEFNSAVLFFKNNDISRNIIDDWIRENNKNNNSWDQVTLGKVVKNKYKNQEYKLPKEYCSIFDRKDYQNIDRVISQWQASRKLKFNNRIEKFNNYTPRNINKKYKCAFIHIPKTGGTTIEILLFGSNKKNPNAEHLSIDNYSRFYDFFIFSFVRNPYTRIISVYNYYKNGGDKSEKDKKLLNKECNLNNFLEFHNKNNMFHLKSQHSFLKKSKNINYIAKFENFEKELNKILKIINFKQTNSIQKHRKTNYIDYLIKPTLIDKINNIYKDDFKYYNYKMITINKSMKLSEFTELL